MITRDDMKRLLRERQLFPASVELGEGGLLHLDSMSLVWLLTILEQEHSILVDPGDVDLEQLTSFEAVWRLVEEAGSRSGASGDPAAPGGEV